MSVLDRAGARVVERAEAMGVFVDGGATVEQDDALRVFLSGLPVTAEEIAPVLVFRTDMAWAAVMREVDFGAVMRGALAEAVLLGYYLAREEDR